ALSQNAASAGVPEALIGITVQAAVRFAAGTGAAAGLISTRVTVLTEGGLKAMLVTKFKIAAAVVVTMGIVGTGAGVLSYSTRAAEQADGPPAEKSQAQTPPKTDADQRKLAELETEIKEFRDRAVNAEINYKAALEHIDRLLDQLAKQNRAKGE